MRDKGWILKRGEMIVHKKPDDNLSGSMRISSLDSPWLAGSVPSSDTGHNR